MKRVAMMLLVPVVLFAAGMHGGQTPPTPGMPRQGMAQGMMSCPMNLQGTSAAVADTATGVTVTFTTKPEHVTELQKRVEQMTAMHGGQPSSPGMMQGQMMPGTARYDATKDGAKLTLTPKDPAKLTEFRTLVRARVEKMQKGECSMMQDMMQGMMGNRGKAEAEPEPTKDEVDHSAHHPGEKK